MITKGIRGRVKENYSIGAKGNGNLFIHLKMICNKKKIGEMKKGCD